MFNKNFKIIFIALILIIMCASSAECMIAQETTQLEVKIKAVAEWLNTVDMKFGAVLTVSH